MKTTNVNFMKWISIIGILFLVDIGIGYSASQHTQFTRAAKAFRNSDTEKDAIKTLPAAQEVIDRLLAEVENSDPKKPISPLIKGYLQQLKDYGDEGSKAIRAFLRKHEDIDLRSNKNENFGTLRTALIANLYWMDNASSREANREVLATTPSPAEIFLAAKNLEKFAPGNYRQEVLAAISATIKNLSTLEAGKQPITDIQAFSMADIRALEDRVSYRNKENAPMLELIGYYQAKEMMPEIEAWIPEYIHIQLKEKSFDFEFPYLTDNWISVLRYFPGEDQAASLQRLANDEKVSICLWGSGALTQLDLQNASVQQVFMEAFSNRMSAWHQMEFVRHLGEGYYGNDYRLFSEFSEKSQSAPISAESTYLKIASSSLEKTKILIGVMKFLDTLEAKVDTSRATSFERHQKMFQEMQENLQSKSYKEGMEKMMNQLTPKEREDAERIIKEAEADRKSRTPQQEIQQTIQQSQQMTHQAFVTARQSLQDKLKEEKKSLISTKKNIEKLIQLMKGAIERVASGTIEGVAPNQREKSQQKLEDLESAQQEIEKAFNAIP